MTKDEHYDKLIKNEIFPDAQSVFSWKPRSLEAIKADCLIVLDTNILLVPYTVASSTLKEIGTVYRQVKSQQRMVVPGQVAREFALLRNQKVSDLVQALSDRNSKIQDPKFPAYPLLDSLEEYKEVLEIQEKLGMTTRALRKAIKEVSEKVTDWTWQDPVSDLYAEVFDGSVVDLELDRARLEEDLVRRQIHKIPPGYKDAGKEDSGIGDLIIWHTIVDLGRTSKRDLLFVTADEKADWWHRANNSATSPRVELVEEYRIASAGRTFHMISLSGLLDLYGASEVVVDDVRAKETKVEQPSIVWKRRAERQRPTVPESIVEEELYLRLRSCLETDAQVKLGNFVPGPSPDLVIQHEFFTQFDYVVEIRSGRSVASSAGLAKLASQAAAAAENYTKFTGRQAQPIGIVVEDPEGSMRAAYHQTGAHDLVSIDSIVVDGVPIYLFEPFEIVTLDCRQILEMFPNPNSI